MSTPTPAFIDAGYAAERLGVPVETVLDWVAGGKLRTYGGRATNPFLRSAEVLAIGSELGLPKEVEVPRRVKSVSAKVQTRITADARWSDVSDDDLREWASRADPTRRQAARKAATAAKLKLETMLAVLDDLESAQ
jgi:hypothetical protein